MKMNLEKLYETLDTDDIHGTYLKDYPKDFDVKEIHDDLNTCEECGIIVRWYDEMYWQDTGGEYYHYGMDKIDVTALCDECHSKFCHSVKYKKTKKDIEDEKKYGEPLLLCNEEN